MFQNFSNLQKADWLRNALLLLEPIEPKDIVQLEGTDYLKKWKRSNTAEGNIKFIHMLITKIG